MDTLVSRKVQLLAHLVDRAKRQLNLVHRMRVIAKVCFSESPAHLPEL